MLWRFQDGNAAVKTILHPWQLLLMCLAVWLQRDQQQVIEFYQAQLEAMLQAQIRPRQRSGSMTVQFANSAVAKPGLRNTQ